MVEIIPAINAESFEEVKEKTMQIEAHAKWVHIDIADGTFTTNTLWHEPRDLAGLKTKLKIEVHLMLADMDLRWPDWILPNVSRVIFHLEGAHDPAFVIKKIKEAGKKVGLAIRPETPWQHAEPYLKHVDLIQTLAVVPGEAGQEFRPEILDKISHLRASHSEAIIEVDGGINPKTAIQCIYAGANILVSASYIFNSDNIKKAIEELTNL